MSKNLNVVAPVIPQSHADFANELAAIADKYRMDRFTMTYRPNFDERFSDKYDSRIHGDMKIHYSSVDGRGRPSKNLKVCCEANFSIQIKSNPESSS